MKIINLDNPHRRKHFEFFTQMEQPHFSLVSHIEFEAMRSHIKDHSLHFSSVVVYLICKAANSVPEFRWRIRGDQIVEHDVVSPSFTVPTENSDVFSFCYVDYTENFKVFSEQVAANIALMHTEPSFEDDPDRDDFLFLSAIPWVHFTGFTHAMRVGKVDSVPRITWGKLGGSGGGQLPLGVQAHHATVNGRHMGAFFQAFQDLCYNPGGALDL